MYAIRSYYGLLGLSPDQIQELAKDILFGQLRLVIATMTISYNFV